MFLRYFRASFPNMFITVQRPEWVVVEWYDENLKKSVDKFGDIWAKCIQHEIDHLDGKLFIDYLGPIKRSVITRKMVKLKKELSRKL